MQYSKRKADGKGMDNEMQKKAKEALHCKLFKEGTVLESDSFTQQCRASMINSKRTPKWLARKNYSEMEESANWLPRLLYRERIGREKSVTDSLSLTHDTEPHIQMPTTHLAQGRRRRMEKDGNGWITAREQSAEKQSPSFYSYQDVTEPQQNARCCSSYRFNMIRSQSVE